MDDALSWRQANVLFPDWNKAEEVAAARIAPQIDVGGLAPWWFMRKAPFWRIRYQPVARDTGARIERHLDELAIEGHITGWVKVIYEPEVHAFGGAEAMAAAHRLFHGDSRAILAYLREQPPGTHRREISLMLCSIMMRAARQDICEQGDIWARVAGHRKPSPAANLNRPGLVAQVSRLITVNAEEQMREGAPLAHCADWAAAYSDAGRELASLAEAGRLHRGLRDVLAHHVIFSWNRIGLTYEVQSVLAGTAIAAIFGLDPILAEPG
jgi:thiopeptide-type bacteriocin biosynthesis protein